MFRDRIIGAQLPDMEGKLVCVIDDDPSQFAICEGLLKGTNCSLQFFESAEAAYDYLEENKVDLILADVMMPGMDGWELHSRVRATSKNCKTAFIFTTCLISKNQEPLMSDEFAHTMTLSKPVDSMKLFKAIRKVLPVTAVS